MENVKVETWCEYDIRFVELMEANEKFDLGISISEAIYKKYA